MTDQTRYRIVCADGEDRHGEVSLARVSPLDMAAFYSECYPDCGPHAVEPVEPVAPDPTCAQSSCAKCQGGKPDKCAARPYYTPHEPG